MLILKKTILRKDYFAVLTTSIAVSVTLVSLGVSLRIQSKKVLQNKVPAAQDGTGLGECVFMCILILKKFFEFSTCSDHILFHTYLFPDPP